MNVAVMLVLLVIVMVQEGLVPVQAPDQLVKLELGDGVAVSVMDVPDRNVVVQVFPQSIPVGVDVMVPVPVPFAVMLSDRRGVSVPLTMRQPAGSSSGIPITPPLMTPSRVAPARFAPVRSAFVSKALERLMRLRSVLLRFAPVRLAPGPMRYPLTSLQSLGSG